MKIVYPAPFLTLTSQQIQDHKNRLTGELMPGVIHELNNPTSYVNSNIEYLKESFSLLKNKIEDKNIKEDVCVETEELFEEMDEVFTETFEGLEQLTGLLKTLSRFTRSSRFSSNIDFNQILSETLLLCHNEFKYKSTLEVKKQELPPLPSSFSSIDWKHVILCILLNASQSIEEKGEIQIQTYHSHSNLILELKDNGKGISEQELQKITQVKEQGSSKEQRALGLLIARNIIQHAGGQLLIASELGKGTTVRLQIPIVKESCS